MTTGLFNTFHDVVGAGEHERRDALLYEPMAPLPVISESPSAEIRRRLDIDEDEEQGTGVS